MISSTTMTILGAVLPIYGIMILGAVVRWKNWLNVEADQSLMRLMLNVLFPCLIFEKIAGNPALGDITNVSYAPLAGFFITVLGFFTAYCFSRLIQLPPGASTRTFSFTVGTCNYGYVPIPLTILLFDDRTLGALFLHNVGVEIAFWMVGATILSGKPVTGAWKQILSAPVIAILAGIFVTYTGFKPHIPDMLFTGMRMLGQCAIPSALILIGAIIFDHLTPGSHPPRIPVIATACFVRLALLPVLILLIARALPCSLELKHVLVLQAAMPTAVFPIVLTKLYEGDVPTALGAAVGTSLISIITTPLWIQVGLRVVG